MLGAGEGALPWGRLGRQEVRRGGSGAVLVPVAVLVLRRHLLQGADWPRRAAHDSWRDQGRCRLVELRSPVLRGRVLHAAH